MPAAPRSGSLLAALLAGALLAAGCGGGDDGSDDQATATATVVKTVTEPQKTTDTQTTETETTETQTTTTGDQGGVGKVVHVRTFRSPTGNIGCVAFGGGVRCDIRDRDWSPPQAPSNCTLDYGQGLSVGRTGPGRLVCAGDTTLNPQAKALAYGTASRNGDVICVSREEGMACTNRDGHGFFLSRQRYRAF